MSLVQRRQDLPFIQGLRTNLAMLHGVPATDPMVEAALARVLRNMAHSYVDLFQAVNGTLQQLYAARPLDTATVKAVEACRANGQGLILVGAHMGSFDMVLLAPRPLSTGNKRADAICWAQSTLDTMEGFLRR